MTPSTEKYADPRPNIGRQIVAGVEALVGKQRADGALVYGAGIETQWWQQGIFPMAFCWAGLDHEKKLKQSPEIAAAITKLGDYLVANHNDKGEYRCDKGYIGVDQRLTYAWMEALRILRDDCAPFEMARWQDKIIRSCETLKHKMEKLVGVRRFIVRIVGTGTNHAALYLSTIYRAGMVFNRPDFCAFALPIIRALAKDVHPDGYWEEHSDLQRSGGPTIMYNYLTTTAIGLMHAWTNETVFADALERSTKLYCNFVYPDATYLDLIDERVRYDIRPFVWGLFGFSRSMEGRGSALLHMEGWKRELARTVHFYGEDLARMCENFLYWQPGDVAPPSFARTNNQATLALPAGIFKRGPWCVGLSCMRATTPEDAAYATNDYALERQKLFSLWHERTGLLIDGSNAKRQPENSTFCSLAGQAPDYWPCGGEVSGTADAFTAKAAYKAFYGTAEVRTPGPNEAVITLSVDPVCSRGPFTAGFTVTPLEKEIATFAGKNVKLGEEAWALSAKDLGGGFRIGPASFHLPPSAVLHWPFISFFSYTPDNKAPRSAWRLRVAAELDIDRTSTTFGVKIG